MSREPAMPVLAGSPRSGTTLLRLMLDSHPMLAIPPETGFLGAFAGWPRATDGTDFFDTVTIFPPGAPAWPDFQLPADALRDALSVIDPFTVPDGLRAFFRLYAVRFGKPRWGDKTPGNALHIRAIAELLPESRFIHIVRDGRDVAGSLRQMWFSPGWDMATQAAHWRHHVLTARAQGAAVEHYLEIRYEDLVLDTAAVLQRVCAFLELPYDPMMLRSHERAPERLAEHLARHASDGTVIVSHEQRLAQQQLTTRRPDGTRVFAWHSTMSGGDRDGFEAVAGDALAAFGYPIRS
jgi:hypothetical protein